MIVMKFGGTSVENVAAMDRSISVVKQNLSRKPFVVVSAFAGVTNALLEAANLAVLGESVQALSIAYGLETRHLAPAWKMPNDFVQRTFRSLRDLLSGISEIRELSPRILDKVLSYGEVLASKIFANRLSYLLGIRAQHEDAQKIMITDDGFGTASPIMDIVAERLLQHVSGNLDSEVVVVMGGFIGSTISGIPTTLGRGGSDYSAAIVGAAMGAEEIQIWTDVDGIMTADPRIVPNARTVSQLSFAEASELAWFGAKVLHPRTIEPAMDKNIPVYILNSLLSASASTRITGDPVSCKNVIKSIACKRDVSVVTVTSSRMLGAIGFLADLFTALKELKVSVDMVSTSEVSVSFTLDDPAKGPEVLDALRRPCWGITLENNMGLVCLVGSDMKFTPGVAARAFGSIQDLHVRMITYGASMTNLAFLVRKEQVEEAVRRLHAEFFSEFDPEVFEEPQV